MIRLLVRWHQGPLSFHVVPRRWWRLSDWRSAKHIAQLHDYMWNHGGVKEAVVAAAREAILTGKDVPFVPWVRKEKIH